MIDRRKMFTRWLPLFELEWIEKLKIRNEKVDPLRPLKIIEYRGKIALFFTNGFYKYNKKFLAHRWVATE